MAESGGNLFVTSIRPTAAPNVEWMTVDWVQDAADMTPVSVAFPAQEIGTTSASQAVALKNTFSGDLKISEITITGPFEQTNNCPTTLSAGEACTINVTFTPTASGVQAGKLSVLDDWAGSPDVISLSGAGTSQ
jgi:hypothetical protein